MKKDLHHNETPPSEEKEDGKSRPGLRRGTRKKRVEGDGELQGKAVKKIR